MGVKGPIDGLYNTVGKELTQVQDLFLIEELNEAFIVVKTA